MGRRKRKIDMLSGLPDEVLHHVLSFLPTKTSVCTSILAKRWKFMWKHVPTLQFSGDHLKNINRAIMLHEAKTVNTFKLSDVKGGCAYQLETSIIYPIQRSVQNLHLDFGFKARGDIACTFPRLLLTCKTLVDLKLVSCGVIPSSGELFLPNLKKLNLSYVKYEDDKSLPHLLSGCPVLEELIVNDCVREEQKNLGDFTVVCFTVSSPTIKTLIFDFSKGDTEFREESLIIDVPALMYLKLFLVDFELVESLRKVMTSLIEAEIKLCGDWHTCDIDCTDHARAFEFISCLCHVKHLKITSNCDKLIDIVGAGSMVKFVNLTKLELNLTINWYNLVKFLEVADNLESLTIILVETLPFTEPKRVPTCMLSRLRTVKISYVGDCEDASEIVRYILGNALVLEMMEIYCIGSDKDKFDSIKRISLFERVSKSCRVAFNTDEIIRDIINLEKPHVSRV